MTASEAKLIGIRCQECNRLMTPPTYSCLTCGSTNIEEQQLSGMGTIYSVVTANLPAIGFEELVPYVLAAVRVEGNLMMTARIEVGDTTTPMIGDKVLFVSAEDGRYVFKKLD